MMMKCLPLAATLAVLSMPCFASAASAPALFPFVLPWDDASSGVATDASFLNAKPAGSNGAIVVKGGHFVESKTGRRIRFLGTNITASACFPTHENAEKVAAHLAKLGINIVRIHHHDNNGSPLWLKTAKGHRVFDPDAVDSLDYFIAQLKKNGIYVNLNLHVSRTFTADDGFDPSVKSVPGTYDKGLDNLDPQMIGLQKEFARNYLAHKNPYTGMAYTDDPCIAVVEINNENSLANWAHSDMAFFNDLPAPFKDEVTAAWNAWLARKYASSDALLRSWLGSTKVAAGTGHAILGAASTWTLEDREGDVKLSESAADAPDAMPTIEAVNSAATNPAWHKQLHVVGLDLKPGQIYLLKFRAKASSARTINVNAALDHTDWANIGLATKVAIGTDWHDFQTTFEAVHPEPLHSRISFTIGGDAGTVDLAGVRLSEASGADLLATGQSLETRSIPLPLPQTVAQRADWRAFLVDTEADYAKTMRDFLRRDLKVHANIIDTQMAYGAVSSFNREAGSDFADEHSYWQHPQFPGKPWDPVNWTVASKAMAADFQAGVQRMTFNRYAGRPYSISEYNEAAPNDYQAEMLPEMASFAALQDWDMFYEFDYGKFGEAPYGNAIQGFFALSGNPAKEAFMPAAALIFRLGLLDPLSSTTTLSMAASAPWKDASTVEIWKKANGGHLPDVLSSRIATAYDGKARESRVVTTERRPGETSAAVIVSAPHGALYTAYGPGAIAVAGFVGGQTVTTPQVTAAFPEFGNNFASVILAAVDGKPLAKSKRILLTVCGKAENADMQWNADHTSVGRNWGHGPVQVEGIPAAVTLNDPGHKKVWALNPTGARLNEVPVTWENGKTSFRIGPEFGTMWYEIAE